MSKEQQIKEMLLDVPQKIVAYDGNPAGQHLYGEQRQEIAEALYNAGYRKTFTSDFASDTQKAYKEGYDKGFLDGREEFDIILQRNKQLLQARKIPKSDIERLKTQLQQANVEIVNCSDCHLVELNAVKDFAEKLKAKAVQEAEAEDYVCYIVDRLLKEYEK